MLLRQQQTHRKREWGKRPAYQIRFYVSLLLFLCYILLDYTGINLYSVNSRLILQEVQNDLTGELPKEGLTAYLAEQIKITEENAP